MKLLIVYARFINVWVFNKTPSVLVTKGFDDFVTVGYLFTETLLVIALSRVVCSLLSLRDYSYSMKHNREGVKVAAVLIQPSFGAFESDICLYVDGNARLSYFTSKLCSDGKEMYQNVIECAELHVDISSHGVNKG